MCSITKEGFDRIKAYLGYEDKTYRTRVPITRNDGKILYYFMEVTLSDDNNYYNVNLVAVSQYLNEYAVHSDNETPLLASRLISTHEEINEMLRIKPCHLHLDCSSDMPCITKVIDCTMNSVCAICLVEDSIVNQVQTRCGHLYHLQCLNDLVRQGCATTHKHPCPTCRTELFTVTIPRRRFIAVSD